MTQPKPTTPQKDDTADAFIAQEKSVKFAGCAVKIVPLDVGQFIELSGDLQAALRAFFKIIEGDDAAPEADQMVQFLGALHTDGAAVLRVLSVSTGLPVATFTATRDIAGLWDVAAAVYEVNRSFFGPQVAHLLGDLKNRLGGLTTMLASGPGQTLSTASAAPDTR